MALIISSCVNDPADVIAATEKIQPSVEKGKDVKMVYSEDGNVTMILDAKRVTRYSAGDPYIEFNDGLKVTFYNPYPRQSSVLEADFGVRYEKTELTIVRDSVVVINDKGDRLDTEELIWNPVEQNIKSDKFVKISTEDEIIFGTGFEADEEFTRYKILNPEGTIKVRDEAKTH
jgi:LPS export ABC transporter protein LptC